MATERLDVVGYWTDVRLQILQEYATAYAQVLANQPFIKPVYVAGAGAHISKQTGEVIEGSPARVLSIQPAMVAARLQVVALEQGLFGLTQQGAVVG